MRAFRTKEVFHAVELIETVAAAPCRCQFGRIVLGRGGSSSAGTRGYDDTFDNAVQLQLIKQQSGFKRHGKHRYDARHGEQRHQQARVIAALEPLVQQ
jgi:hypothetical protein